LVHRKRSNIVAIELNATAIGIDQTGDHVKHGGLAGTIWAKQADCFATSHIKRDAPHHHAAAEAFLHAMCSKIGMTGCLTAITVPPRSSSSRGRRCLAHLRRWLNLWIACSGLVRAGFWSQNATRL
jgi:hypothetical protein